MAGPLGAQKPPSAKDLVRQAEADQQANRWGEAYAKLKQAAQQKPKDKNIADQLLRVANYMADVTASTAQGFCNKQELDKCETELKVAGGYAETPRVEEARKYLAARKKEVQDTWDRIQKMMTDGQLSEAALELDNLDRFSYLLPNLGAEKKRLLQLRIQAAISKGNHDMTGERWDAAIEAFGSAIRLDSSNSEAARRLETAKREKEAHTAFTQAQNAFRSQSYSLAYEANQKAITMFPTREAYRELEKQLAVEWSKVLLKEARDLSSNTENLRDNQKALQNLQTIQKLDPALREAGQEIRTVKGTLFSMYMQKADEYQAMPDTSRVALCYLFYANAQAVNPESEFAFMAKLREATTNFDRKRTMQLIVRVNNVSPAPPRFADVINLRMRAAIEKLGLPDVKLRTLEEYTTDPKEDPQFVELRPDGKSPTVSLTAALTDYVSEQSGGDKPIDKQSKYVAGTEQVANPEYQQLETEFQKVSAAILREKPKPDKATREGYTLQQQNILQQKLITTPRSVTRDKVVDYSYQEYQLKARAMSRLNLEVRDMHEKRLIGADTIEKANESSGIEIQNVKDRDVNGLSNRSARLPPVDQLLSKVESEALQEIDAKVPQLFRGYLQRFYAEGEKAAREGRTEDAVENFLCHWHVFRGQLPALQQQTIRDYVRKATGLDLTSSGAI